MPAPIVFPGKLINRIDLHNHVISQGLIDAVLADQATFETRIESEGDKRRVVRKKNSFALVPEYYDADAKVEAMEKKGIDISMISAAPPAFYYGTKPEIGLKTAGLHNDGIDAMVAKRPDLAGDNYLEHRGSRSGWPSTRVSMFISRRPDDALRRLHRWQPNVDSSHACPPSRATRQGHHIIRIRRFTRVNAARARMESMAVREPGSRRRGADRYAAWRDAALYRLRLRRA